MKADLNRCDDGEYGCTGSGTQISKWRWTVNVIVDYAPDITFNPVHITEGQPLTLQCEARCRPASYTVGSFIQYWGNTSVDIQARTPTGGVYTWSVGAATYLDTGVYECRVNNSVTDRNDVLVQRKRVSVRVRGTAITIPITQDKTTPLTPALTRGGNPAANILSSIRSALGAGNDATTLAEKVADIADDLTKADVDDLLDDGDELADEPDDDMHDDLTDMDIDDLLDEDDYDEDGQDSGRSILMADDGREKTSEHDDIWDDLTDADVDDLLDDDSHDDYYDDHSDEEEHSDDMGEDLTDIDVDDLYDDEDDDDEDDEDEEDSVYNRMKEVRDNIRERVADDSSNGGGDDRFSSVRDIVDFFRDIDRLLFDMERRWEMINLMTTLTAS